MPPREFGAYSNEWPHLQALLDRPSRFSRCGDYRKGVACVQPGAVFGLLSHIGRLPPAEFAYSRSWLRSRTNPALLLSRESRSVHLGPSCSREIPWGQGRAADRGG